MDATQEIKSRYVTDVVDSVNFQDTQTAVHSQSEVAAAENVQQKTEETQASKTQEISEDFAKEIAEKMNEVASVFNSSLSFSVDKPTGKTVIKVVNNDTDELIRQIPPENALKLISNMRNVMGMLLDVEI